MGMVPPGIASWLRKRQETKDERPCKGEWDAIAEQQEEHRHPLLKRPPNPALDIVYGKEPRPRVDLDLIGDYYQ